MTKAQKDLAKEIVAKHYVELTKAKLATAETMLKHVRIYEGANGKSWAKARTRAAYAEMAALE